MIRKVLFGLIFSLSISAAAQFRDAAAPMDYTKWSIHDGKFFDDGKWVFLKTAKPLINYADANSVNSLIKKLDILKEKHYNAVEMNCYWHHFDSNGDGLIDINDITLLVNYILGKTSDGIILENADMNEDSRYDVTDLTLICNAILGKL